MTWKEPVSLSIQVSSLQPIGTDTILAQITNPRKKPNQIKNPQDVPAATLLGPSRSTAGGPPGCQGLLLSSHAENSFPPPPPPNSLPGLSPLHCSVADPAHVLRREVDGTAVTSQPSLGHLPGTATVELSNSERLCPEGQHLHCLAEIWSLVLYHQSRVVKAPAVRWQTWEMTWEDARVSVIDSIDFILKTKQTNAIWVNSLQTRKSIKMEQGTTTSFRTPGLCALPQHRNQRFPFIGG